MSAKKSLKERFFDKIRYNPSTGCMEWTASTLKGYGKIKAGGRDRYAHRVRYELETGLEIPDGIKVRHYVCNNPRCVTFAHLVLGTSEDNGADMVMWGRQAKGEKNGRARVSDEVKDRAVALYKTGQFTMQELGDQFGVSRHAIGRWVTGKIRAS